ncbi:uncharacterized protein LOC144647961, partial [Oculina patagonica]
NDAQFTQNTIAPTAAVLAPFQHQSHPGFIQPSSSRLPTPSPPVSASPVSFDAEDSSEASENSAKAGRGYGKWREAEEKLLVQLWCDKHTRLESRHARQVWEEIAKEVSKIRKVTSTQCQRKIKYLKDRYKEAKDHNRNKTGGDRKTSPFYEEIDSVLGCRDIVTFSHVEESSPSTSGTSSRSPGSSNDNNEKDDEEIDEEEFEQSLAVFGLNKKRERKSQRRDERKRAKTAKATRKERDEDDDLFRESMEKLQAQGDKLTNVLEAMEKNQTQQLQIMNQFMTNFMQAMQPKNQE